MSDLNAQQINLYRPARAPLVIGIELTHILLIWGLTLVVLGGVSGYVLWQKNGANNLYQIALKAEERAVDELSEQQVLSGDKKEELSLRSQIGQLVAERNQISTTIEQLLSLGLNKPGGFTPVFNALAERHVTGTWYTRIVLQADGRYVSLTGSAIEADLVPDIFTALDQNDLFEGRGFDSLQLTVDGDTNLVNFSMRSTTSR